MSKNPHQLCFPTVASLRERQHVTREDAILTVALMMMDEIGYGTMTMDDLAARAGISKPTLYTYFASKEAIAVRAVVRMMERGRAFVDARPPTTPAFERIEATVDYLCDGKFVHRMAYLGTGHDALGPTIRAHPEYRSEYGKLAARITALFEEARDEGTLKPGLATRVAVQALFSLLRDAEYTDLIARGECDARAVAYTLRTIFLDGLRTKDRK